MTSANDDSIRVLAAMARRLRSNPSFMAHILANYQQQKGLDDEALAQQLGTLPEMVVRLALCKRPEADCPNFADQVRDLSDYALIDEVILTDVINQADNVTAMVLAQCAKTESATAFSALTKMLTAVRHQGAMLVRKPIPVIISVVAIAALFAGVHVWLEYQKAPPSGTANRGEGPADITARTSAGDSPASETAPESSQSPAASAIEPSSTQHSQANDRRSRELIAKVYVKIDLDEYTVLRESSESESGREKTIKLPFALTRLLIRLPEGSLKGIYDVSIVDAYGKPLISVKSKSSNGKALTTVLDLRKLSQKRYRLCVSRKGEAPGYYPVLIDRS